MEVIVQDLFQKLSDITDKFLAALEAFSEEQLVSKEDSENWSPNQVMEHLLIAESGTLGYMLKKTSGGWDALPEVDNLSNPEAVGLIDRLNSTMRIKAPAILPEPTNKISKDELIAKWKQLRTELELFVHSIPHKNLNKMVFRQPSAGPMNIIQTLQFMEAHVGHHLHQIERIKRKNNL
ncbi:MAG TPA: DinB family protein [Flavobacteriales bacterium]